MATKKKTTSDQSSDATDAVDTTTAGDTAPETPTGEATTAGEDAGADVAANNAAAAAAEEERIQALVDARVKLQLEEAAKTAEVLSADQYGPRYDNTMVPLGNDPVNNADQWLKIPRAEFTAEHAQALIDHFKKIASSQKDFNLLSAVNTQLVVKE